MPTYVIIGRDSERGLELRKLHRPAHLERIAEMEDAGRMRFAGALLDENGDPHGSIICFDADDRDAARAFAEGDPYVTGGVFESYELSDVSLVIPRMWWG